MVISMKRVGVVGVLGLAVACGRAEQQDFAELDAETLAGIEEANLQTDDAAVSMSLTIGQQSKTGLIVVERSISVRRAVLAIPAVYPPPSIARCILHAGAHLVNVKNVSKSGESFTANVSYPQTVKFPVLKKSCRAGQAVIVEAQSGFEGLAITANSQGVEFLRKEKATVSLPYCKPIQGRMIDLLGWSKIVKYKDECEHNELKKSGFVKISDDELICTQIAGVLMSPSGQKVHFKNGCHRAALLSHGYGSGADAVKPGLGVAGASVSDLVASPKIQERCFVYAGRGNIRISAPKGSKGFSGKTTAASAVLDTMYRFDECERGAQLVVDGLRLEKALKESKPTLVVCDLPTVPTQPVYSTPATVGEPKPADVPAAVAVAVGSDNSKE